MNIRLPLLVLAACVALPMFCRADDIVKPLEVRKVFANGKHNAFTAMRRFKGDLWLAFRSGDAHNSPTADVLVLRSKDGREWQQAHTFDVAKDDRDPQMVVTEQRLFLSPSLVAWLSVIPAFTAARADTEPTQFYRVVLKSELVLLAARGDGMSKTHWDASATYFLTAANGIMIRHFRGYFDHNLRDYNLVTSVMLVWKFQ